MTDNEDKKHPDHLKAPDPGPCPRPSGCSCVWTALDHGWIRGYNTKCKVHDS